MFSPKNQSIKTKKKMVCANPTGPRPADRKQLKLSFLAKMGLILFVCFSNPGTASTSPDRASDHKCEIAPRP